MRISAVYRKQWNRVQILICSLEQKLRDFSLVQETRGLHNVEPTLRSLWKPKNQTCTLHTIKLKSSRRWTAGICEMYSQYTSPTRNHPWTKRAYKIVCITVYKDVTLEPVTVQEILKTGKPYISFPWWRALTHLSEIFATMEMISSLWEGCISATGTLFTFTVLEGGRNWKGIPLEIPVLARQEEKPWMDTKQNDTWKCCKSTGVP